MASGHSASIEILPTLGRPFQLGMLYDCHNDALIPGVTLWDKEMIRNDLSVAQQPKTEFKIIASDRIEDKTSSLDISASLKASFLGGLVEVSGAAKYLKETKTSKHQARVTLQYSTTTKFEELTMKHLGPKNISYPAVFDQGMATHVVTAVLFGGQAFFVFDREVSSAESMKVVHGALKAAVQKIPQIDVEGEGALTMKDTDKANVEKFSCTFCGDFALKNNPSTYEEAINIYKSLPSLLGEKGENAVPVKVWLYPLNKLDSRAAQLVRSISAMLVDDVQAAMEELSDINMQCNDMLNQPAAIHFPDIKNQIQQFQTLCKQYRQTFQKDLCRVLPSIRGGGEEERALVDILTGRGQSPFSSQKLIGFLEAKNLEVNLVSNFLNELMKTKEVRIVSTESDMNQLMLDRNTEAIVSFTFTSLGGEEPYLLDLKRWLQLQYVSNTSEVTSANPECGKEEPRGWFSDVEIKNKMIEYFKAFTDFANSNALNQKIKFIVSSLPDPSNAGASMYLYEGCDLTSTEFQPPRSSPPVIGRLSHDSVQLKPTPPPPGGDEILGYRVEYRGMNEESWTTMEGGDTNEGFTVTGLHPNFLYQFRQSAVLERWAALPSDTINRIKTLPTSPPWKLVVLNETPNTADVTWQEPDCIGAGVRISEYKIEYMKEAGDTSEWIEKRTGKKTESWRIEGLNPNTPYRFQVSAICGKDESSDPSEEYVSPVALETFPAELKRRHLSTFKLPVTLDPDSAHPQLILSEGWRRVRRKDKAERLPDNPRRFTYWPCVLGSEGFTSGRHYWELQLLQERVGWNVGVAGESVPRKRQFTWSHEGGVWAVRWCNGWYTALTSPPSPLSPRERPGKLGVYLDYEGGRLSLYNADTMEHLYTFPRASFTQRVFPFFCLWEGAELSLV